jgi:Family of unknown function (DUF6807)
MNRFDRGTIEAILLVWIAGVGAGQAAAADAATGPVAFAEGHVRVTVVIDGLPVAVYCYQDEKIPRPFFAHVRALNGVQVTRNHPPIEGLDLVDHVTFHPGIWLAFGDINGSDYWRIAARVRHAGFVDPPRGGNGEGKFAVHNEYLDQKDPSKIVCEEIARYRFVVRPAGYLLLWDSTFRCDHEFAFGDQQEMGLGFRVATPLRVAGGGEGKPAPGNGRILDSEGRKNEREVCGNSAAWCDYGGTIAGQSVGLTIFCHPSNFRPSWFHARDNGLLEANPFGRQAFRKGDKSSVVVRPGEEFRLRYGIFVRSGPKDAQVDYPTARQDYLELAGK